MKVLLSPAVLHFTSLEMLQNQPLSFIKKYIYRFGFIQGLVIALLYIMFFVTVVFPFANTVNSVSEVVLTHASFSRVKINDGTMNVDIKPAIWTFTTKDTATYQYVVAVDTTGEMNPYFFDDRFVGGMSKRVEGLVFSPSEIMVKMGNKKSEYPYTNFVGNRSMELTKGDVFRLVQKYFSNKAVIWLLVLTLPLVYFLGVGGGIALHVLFSYISGVLIAFITTDTEINLKPALKVGSGLYVGWFYVTTLLLLALNIEAPVLVSIERFYYLVQVVLFLSLVLIGYCSVKYTKIWNSPAFAKGKGKVVKTVV